jgi:hypothetical protein
MAYTPLHQYLHGMVETTVLTMEAVDAVEGRSVDGGNSHGYGNLVLGRSQELHKTM